MSELEVIGAGFGRTGTFSLKTALEVLGYKTHHMEAVAVLGQAKTWQNIHAGTNVDVSPLNFLSVFSKKLEICPFSKCLSG